VEDFKRQLKEIEATLEGSGVPTDDRSAQEKYVEALEHLKIEDKGVPHERKLVKDLLGRCILWAQIIEEKYVG
jgi:hypothetical protein